MSSGIRATVAFGDPAGCPVARFSAATDTVIDGVSTSVASGPDGPAVTEFLAEAAEPPEEVAAESVFSYGTEDIYRVTHAGACPCTCLGQFGCPIHRYAVEDGALTVVFHAEGFEQLQAVMGELREQYSVDVQRLLQPPLSGNPEERVFVNRGKLTDRQLEVLLTAYQQGYFERPKSANATEIADELGVSRSTFTEHLAAAQRKLFEDVLDGV